MLVNEISRQNITLQKTRILGDKKGYHISNKCNIILFINKHCYFFISNRGELYILYKYSYIIIHMYQVRDARVMNKYLSK